ncbi:MAG: AbrB/MazE/SpoVT family DNA-binding domain-containing protein [Anaerolineae bacterium]|nr:AbrB/MazE/SpoVT family DNA-binding domain-containing protein [Anaerolineae bacterium]
MGKKIRSKIIQIGNSRGVRIPHTLLEQAGLYEAIQMHVEGNQLIIQPAAPRTGWAEQFALMAANQDDGMLDEPTTTHWDDEDWQW